jgi:2-polyprenyl-6-methoxyphenol hydroxylase-like FAD-dependent oxidoreductase
LKDILVACLGLAEHPHLKEKLLIQSTSTWRMDAVVADQYVFPSTGLSDEKTNGKLSNRVILVGDAAHRYASYLR